MNRKLETKIIDLLVNHPDEWEVNAYTCKHLPSGVEIWIENRPYADLYVYKPSQTRRFRGYFRRKALRGIIDSIGEERILKAFTSPKKK